MAEFSENYNRLAAYSRVDDGKKLDETGKWVASNAPNQMYISAPEDAPNFQYTEQNGYLHSLSFTQRLDGETFAGDYRQNLLLATRAFVGAQRSYRFYEQALPQLLNAMVTGLYEGFDETLYGVRLTCEAENVGFFSTAAGLFPNPDAPEQHFSLHFTLEKE